MGTEENVHPKWGRFKPQNRFNFDQVPLPFAVNLKDTYVKVGSKRVWVAQNTCGMDKRFCSLLLCFRPAKGQPKPTIIFRGRGKRISAVEKASRDNRVNVMFQEKAWADRPVMLEWAEKYFCPYIINEVNGGVNSGEECVAFCDDLDSHLTPDFLGLLRAVGCFRFLYPPNCSIEVQAVVDAGLGSNTKYLPWPGKSLNSGLRLGITSIDGKMAH